MNPTQLRMQAETSAFFPLFLFAAIWLGVTFLLSWLSGWRLLAQRFRAQEPWNGQRWGWQSARLRVCSYNHCLTFGASPAALYLSIMPLFGLFNPALLIPWQEIEVETGKLFFGWYDTALLKLGTQERVSVRIYGKLVDRLRGAAGPGWPRYQQEQLEAQTKGIQGAS